MLDELRQEGREEERIGERRGERIGARKGGALALLAARFGPVPAEAKAQILAANEPALARWSLRVRTRSADRVVTRTVGTGILHAHAISPAGAAAPSVGSGVDPARRGVP